MVAVWSVIEDSLVGMDMQPLWSTSLPFFMP